MEEEISAVVVLDGLRTTAFVLHLSYPLGEVMDTQLPHSHSPKERAMCRSNMD